jgi:hypothetical protein
VANDLPAQNNNQKQNPVRDGVYYRRSLIRTTNNHEGMITHGFLFGRCQGVNGDVRTWPTGLAANTGNGATAPTPIADGKRSQKVVAKIAQMFPAGTNVFNWYELLNPKPLGWEDFHVNAINRPADGSEIGLKPY